MKIKLTSPWNDHGIIRATNSIVDVGEATGLALIAQGHEQVHPDTPGKKNPEMYDLGCVPSPFSAESISRTFTEKLPDKTDKAASK
jgi:hypothetical protein